MSFSEKHFLFVEKVLLLIERRREKKKTSSMWTEPCAMCWVDICVCLQICKKAKQVEKKKHIKKKKFKNRLKSASSRTLNTRATKINPSSFILFIYLDL